MSVKASFLCRSPLRLYRKQIFLFRLDYVHFLPHSFIRRTDKQDDFLKKVRSRAKEHDYCLTCVLYRNTEHSIRK